MESVQYEELCRHFIAESHNLPLERVQSVRIANPRRPNLPQYAHQIDLCWETGGELAVYFNIANTKWRGTDRVDQADVLLLQQVRLEVAAHKAFMITNVGFTRGASAAAQHHGIALHVLQPHLDGAALPTDRAEFQDALRRMSASGTGSLYTIRVEHRGLEPGSAPSQTGPASGRVGPITGSLTNRVVQPSAGPVVAPQANRALSGVQTRGDFGPRSGPSGTNRAGG